MTDRIKFGKGITVILLAIMLGACGGGGGGGGTSNLAPVANAGLDQNVSTGSAVTLDGTTSTDPDGASLTYAWAFTTVPPGSAAAIANPSAPRPTFNTDVDGQYVISLVVNDGDLDSTPDTVVVTATTGNSAPVANAGPDQNVATGAVVTLDGTASTDADGDTLTYAWSLAGKPSGSAANLANAAAAHPSFTADRDGQYLLSLTVNDGTVNSVADTVTITAATANSAPVANAGPDQGVTIGTLVTLDGSGSTDADGDALSYSWTLTAKPSGSAATLTDASTVQPRFTADAIGQYVVSLVVNDGIVDSAVDTVTITATLETLAVGALFPNNGANWNAYVKGMSIFTATDLACDAATDGGNGCVHGGEFRVVELPGRTSCTGLSLNETLGAFDWGCDVSTGTARFVSYGLKTTKHLADLIDFTTAGWKNNSVTVSDNGIPFGSSPSSAWWANPVAVDNDGGNLATAGTIYLVTTNAVLTAGYTIAADGIALVIEPGKVVHWPSAVNTGKMIWAYKNFIWIEGMIDATNAGYGVFLDNVRFSQLRNVEADNAGQDGIHLIGSSLNWLSEVTALSNQVGVYIINSTNNTFRNGLTVSSNNSDGLWLSMSSYNQFESLSAFSNGASGVNLYATADHNGFSEIKAANNGAKGVDLQWGTANAFGSVSAVGNADSGISLDINASSNTFSRVSTINNGVHGVILNGSNGNVLADVMATNNTDFGLYLYNSADNKLARVRAASNGVGGIYLGASRRNVLTGVTAVNNAGSGILLNSSGGNTFAEVTVNNNNGNGVWLASASSNTFSGSMASDNGNNGYSLALSSTNYFTDLLRKGNNAAGNCVVVGGTDPGLDNTCRPQGASDFEYTQLIVTAANSFVGKVLTNDPSNPADSNGTISSPGSLTFLGWTIFANDHRAWGLEGSAFPSADHRGQWISGTGRIWDWSLAAADGTIRIANALPTGNDTLTHTWLDNSTTTFLRRAVEIQGDLIGNDNTLCESGEACLYMPNLGSYQGHGALVSAGTFTNGTLTGITLMKYQTNGR